MEAEAKFRRRYRNANLDKLQLKLNHLTAEHALQVEMFGNGSSEVKWLGRQCEIISEMIENYPERGR